MTDPWSVPDADSPWALQATPEATPQRPWYPYSYLPPAPAGRPARADRFREAVTSFGYPLVALVLLGAPLGLLWVWVTPRVGVVETAAGLEFSSPEGSTFFAADGWFFVLSVLAGLACALAVWRVLRGRGPAVPLGLVAGALLGAQIAREIGGRVIVDERVHRLCAAPDACRLYDGTLAVRASAMLLVWALVAVVAYLALTAVFDRERPATPPPPAWPPPVWPPPAGEAGATPRW